MRIDQIIGQKKLFWNNLYQIVSKQTGWSYTDLKAMPIHDFMITLVNVENNAKNKNKTD